MRMRRFAAALIAVLAWMGLAVQFEATRAQGFSVHETLWVLTRYFTVLTNFLVAAVMTLEAFGKRVSDSLLAGTLLAIVLVGIVYMTLLRGLVELSGGAQLADLLLHKVTPLMVPAWWLAFAPKGGLRWRDPFLWASYPMVYFIYALLRGVAGDRYPYPFIDVSELGLAQVTLNAAFIAGAFIVTGLALVMFSRWLGRASRKR